MEIMLLYLYSQFDIFISHGNQLSDALMQNKQTAPKFAGCVAYDSQIALAIIHVSVYEKCDASRIVYRTILISRWPRILVNAFAPIARWQNLINLFK